MEAPGRGVDMAVQVLTTGYWPAYPPMEVPIPPELVCHREHFNSYYAVKYQGRRLMWQYSLAHCIVRARFPLGRKELDVSLFQTLVLQCFNGADNLSFKDVKERTGIEDGELRRTLQSLACGKVGYRLPPSCCPSAHLWRRCAAPDPVVSVATRSGC